VRVHRTLDAFGVRVRCRNRRLSVLGGKPASPHAALVSRKRRSRTLATTFARSLEHSQSSHTP
jgi:hypothetical protein